jgi:putative transposase
MVSVQKKKWCQFIFPLQSTALGGNFVRMPRLPRPVADGLVYHALNRGNNRQAVFASAQDHQAFLQALAQTQLRYPFRLYAYCLMTNHFHLVLEPEAGQSVSRILQSLTVAHTWRFHKRHGSLGHVWQGRFKSPVIQDDDHLLTVVRYVESNPLRAGMVTDLIRHPWSSYAFHALGRADPLLRELPGWDILRSSATARQRRWRTWLHTPLSQRELAALRRSVTSGRPFGSEAWVGEIAARLGLPLATRPRGRPRKEAGKMN